MGGFHPQCRVLFPLVFPPLVDISHHYSGEIRQRCGFQLQQELQVCAAINLPRLVVPRVIAMPLTSQVIVRGDHLVRPGPTAIPPVVAG